LVFEFSLSHYTRLLQEIGALQDAGASVRLLTSHDVPSDSPASMDRTLAPLDVNTSIPPSTLRWRPLRIADNLTRNLIRPWAGRVQFRRSTRVRDAALRSLVRQVDLFWVIDFPSLPSVLRAVRSTDVKVVYETVDLVPEYQYVEDAHRQKSLDDERRAIGRVDGFITACDSYADYYVERYGDDGLRRRPFVRDNMPSTILSSPRPTSRPLSFIFLGSLMFDRPVEELIEAVSLTTSGATLTFQGKNYLGDKPDTLIAQMGLQSRVRICEPCPPETIVQTASEYDVGIVALRGENENERRASTSKLFTFMSAGLAILGSNLPGIARVVDAHHNGRLVDGMEPRDWALALDELALLPDTAIDEMKRRSLLAAETYSWDKQRPGYVAEFVRALGARPGQSTDAGVA
jgi:glycosyltransferase involved in cell wall biosynthesis